MTDTTHKISVPIFSNNDTDLEKAEPELWWPRFVLYLEITMEVDIRKYMDGTENLTDEQIKKIKRLLTWAIGEKAIKVMIRHTHREPWENMTLKRIIELFKERFLDDKTTQLHRTEFFEMKAEKTKHPSKHGDGS